MCRNQPKLIIEKPKRKTKERIQNSTHLFFHDILRNNDVIIIAYDSFSIVQCEHNMTFHSLVINFTDSFFNIARNQSSLIL